MDDTQAVLDCLRRSQRLLTTQQVADATKLSVTVVDRALQLLLFRRMVVCGSFDPPGRGGQDARVIGSHALPLWSAAPDDE
jgi:hypothetical protein